MGRVGRSGNALFGDVVSVYRVRGWATDVLTHQAAFPVNVTRM